MGGSTEKSRGVCLFGVRFAPFNVPLERRIQTLGVLIQFFVMFVLPIATTFFFLLSALICPPLFLGYAFWLWRDWDSPRKGGYPSQWFRNLRLHKWFCDYFPMKLHATADLPTDKNYLIGIHPHGIVAHSGYQFMSNATGINDRFPGIRFHIATLVANFLTPLRREWLLLHGMINCSKESLLHVLGGDGRGEVAILVVGGAEEALDAHPGRHRLTLVGRKGFVKIALQTGAQLVPCFAFGENDCYEQAELPKEGLGRMFQRAWKRLTTFTWPAYHGRGVFNYSFGILPFRAELNTVLGAPIDVEKTENPTQEQIDSLHSLYVDRLTDLYETHKERFGVAKDNKLVIQ